jgi:penicillin-binding protein 1A
VAKKQRKRQRSTAYSYNQLIKTPIVVHYRSLDHKEGMAPYFRKELRTEVQSILLAKKADGTFKYLREDGNPYDIDADGLKIYTTLNPTMQRYAEAAVERHIYEELQPQFDLNNKGLKNYPFSNSIKPEIVEQIMTSGRHNSDRYKKYVALGLSESEINQAFNEPIEMTVFSLKGERDTVMSPNDSIRYYKAFLHAGMVSVDPRTGFVKAWVGGINFKHFGYDHVRQGKRQVGSTIKPFVYAAALSMKVVNPCTGFSADEYCLDLVDHNTNKVVGQYCPAGPAAPSVKDGLAQSSRKRVGHTKSRNYSKKWRLISNQTISFRPCAWAVWTSRFCKWLRHNVFSLTTVFISALLS